MSKNNLSNQKIADLPENEIDRLEVLKGYHVLDTLPEKQFDDITRLASLICETPITLISFLDEGRQWFKSKQGLEVSETPREISFCQYTILGDDIFEVENSLDDHRFLENPLVTGDPNIRFYAGAPLIAPGGKNLGTLCVIDTVPKKLTVNQREALKILANEVVINLELRKERELIEEERKRAIKSHELLTAFLDHSPAYISLRSAEDGSYLLANKATLQNVNKTAEEMIGSTLQDLFSPNVVEKVLADDQIVIKSGVAETKEYIVNGAETERYFLRHMFPVFNSEGKVYGVGAISNDITESKRLEEETRQSNERFSKLFYNSPISMLILDLDETKFLMVNNTFLKTFGYQAHELIGKKVDQIEFIVCENDRLALRDELSKNGRAINREFRVLKKNGEEFVSLMSIEVIEIDGKRQAISAFQDITMLKEVEKQLEQARQNAEESTMAKSSFLANMSHEIRTPLNVMLGFSELLANSDLTVQQKDFLDAIDTSGKNLLTIINDILDFSKIEAGMFSIEKTPFSIQLALHSVNTMFFEKANNKGLKFFTSIDPKIPALLNGDPTRFSQIMINILGNAIKFTNQGSVSVECQLISLENDLASLKISVTDTGIGISPDKIESIFNRFTQAEENTSRNFGGTGLGLSIVKKLIELQGGEIVVKSELDKGSTFSFNIKYQLSDSKDFEHEIESNTIDDSTLFSNKTVLVVEDNILNQKLASTLLSNLGFEVKLAGNGLIALEQIKMRKFDLILMDIQMPLMDGYQATKEIKQLKDFTTPIIAMTANALAGEREKCIANGMSDYITKPFKTSELRMVIEKTLK